MCPGCVGIRIFILPLLSLIESSTTLSLGRRSRQIVHVFGMEAHRLRAVAVVPAAVCTPLAPTFHFAGNVSFTS